MITFDFDRAIVVPSADDPGSYFYAPKAPGIAFDANGRRQFNLLNAGPVAFLQVTGTWGLSGAETDAIRDELANRLGRQASSLRLKPMPESVAGAALLLGDGEGSFQVLQESKSSGVPPYHAAFNVMLDEAQLATVRKALDGEHRLLALRYDITRRQPRTATESARETASGHSPKAAYESVVTHTGQTTTEEVTTFSVELDAADWAHAR